MLDAEDALAHQNCLLLVAQCLRAKEVHRTVSCARWKVACTMTTRSGGGAVTNLRVVSHDVIETGQQAQAGADLHVHGSVHVVEEVQCLVNQLAALLQETWETCSRSS